ncbi:MAG TPA: hypothetical protein VF649_10550 [Sphingomonas sp.]|jgi:protein ImuA|uniref:ImuA family protein n=1 Tax=Sphingomonas sp. TaxID=28214 RepID=UPI002EDB2053
MPDSTDSLHAIRDRLAWIEGRRADVVRFGVGHAGVDGALDGGLVRGRMHEVCAQDGETANAALGFAILLATRACAAAGQAMLWLRTEQAEARSGGCYAPGLSELGIDPGAVMLAVVRDEVALLQAALDAARCAGLGAVVLECWGTLRALDLTATRRLVLATEASGVTMLLVRIGGTASVSAADTRWGVRAAPSMEMAAQAPGAPMFEVELLRRRAGAAGGVWRMEWNRDEQAFREPAGPAISGAVVRAAAGGTLVHPPAAGWRRAG